MKGHRYKRRGWFNEPHRHSLAAKGISTTYNANKFHLNSLFTGTIGRYDVIDSQGNVVDTYASRDEAEFGLAQREKYSSEKLTKEEKKSKFERCVKQVAKDHPDGKSAAYPICTESLGYQLQDGELNELEYPADKSSYFRSPDKTFSRVSPDFKDDYDVYLDNPGGDWLERKRRLWRDGEIDLSGSVTAVVRGPVDVDELASLPGANNEHLRMDEPRSREKIDAIKDIIRTQGPDAIGPGYIVVWPDGRAEIGEGNHRARALKELGYDDVFWEIQYRGGGEDAQGDWSIESFQERRGYPLPQELNALKVPEYAKRAAKRALDQRGGFDDPPGLTEKEAKAQGINSGVGRAKQLIQSDEIPDKDAKRVAAFYQRFKNRRSDRSEVAIDLWGGREFGKRAVKHSRGLQ